MEHGVIASAAALHRAAGVSHATALTIFKKLTLVIVGEMQEEAPAVPSALFSRTFCKRSRATPAMQHPISEEDSVLEGSQQELALLTKNEAASELSAEEEAVHDLLSDEPLGFDEMCQRTGRPPAELAATLTILELSGLIRRQPGERYVRVSRSCARREGAELAGQRASAPMATEELVAPLVEFIRTRFRHGISRKYLQNYLAALWCCWDKVRWKAGDLLDACLRFGSVTYGDVLSYISPPVVRLPSVLAPP